MEKKTDYIQAIQVDEADSKYSVYAVFYCEPEYARYRKTRYFLTREAAERHCQKEGNVVKGILVSISHMADIIDSIENYYMDENSLFPIENEEMVFLNLIKKDLSQLMKELK